ncbi:ABC transporter ATP-binding protein [Amycolatopsis acidiphila]|uniref:ABC transporter ATP-binding protein n=2 Tax=Amycolatopsis acidiphila TaxID=715473 RepID=A0A558AIQ8_9PSEU|nr:ABC transporter ATP-binding protein [Amycolatopsis acidiphila]GHG87530.1 ABC transporter ATP-binding protein [Amycolatopsis acidiphila]
MLTVSDVDASYGAARILHSVSISVAAGESVVILGPNGHGKTTLLRVISGLVRPSAGRVEFDGRELTGLRPEEVVAAGIVQIPQGDLVFPLMTVKENLLMGAYRTSAWRQRKDNLERVYAIFPRLRERERQLARSLSGGERRMLAIGRGLMSDVRLLIVDEPSLGLAPQVIEDVYNAIRRITEDGLSLLLVDESANHIDGLADRVYLMQTGEIGYEGNAAELLRDDALLSTYLG